MFEKQVLHDNFLPLTYPRIPDPIGIKLDNNRIDKNKTFATVLINDNKIEVVEKC